MFRRGSEHKHNRFRYKRSKSAGVYCGWIRIRHVLDEDNGAAAAPRHWQQHFLHCLRISRPSLPTALAACLSATAQYRAAARDDAMIKQVEKAASGDLNMAWIKPFTSSRRMNAGEVLFKKGETANCLFFVVSGRCRLIETGIDLPPGAVVGELALISADKTRTQTLQCTEAGDLLEITYGQVKQLYYQNPTFGFFFLQLTSGRLFENIKRLELEVAQLRAQLAALSRGSQAAPG